MASAEYVRVNDSGKNDLTVILQEFQKFIHGKETKEVHMSPHFTTIVEGTKNTLHRIDANYWNPKYTKMIKIMTNNFKVQSLGDFISFITYGAIVVGKKRKFVSSGVSYINQINVRNTGLDIFLAPRYIGKNDPRNQPRCKPLKYDILFNRDQIGTIGRCLVFNKETENYAVNDHVDIIRVRGINSHYVVSFLLTKYGQLQVEKLSSGVSGVIGITFTEIKSIQIPILPEFIQQKIEAEYRKMSKYHDLAMEIKAEALKRGKSPKEAEQDPEYQKNIQKAEKMRDDLIKRTEEIIEGKKESV